MLVKLVAYLGVLCCVVPSVRAQEAPRAGADGPPGITLSRVLALALERHPLIEAADARIRAAQGSRGAAGAFPNPILTYQVENTGFPGRAAPVGLDREISFFGTLPLEPLWQRWSRVQRAKENILAAEAGLSLARRQVVLEAARAFHRVALAQVAAQGANDIHEGVDSLIRYVRNRVEEGVASQGDLIRLEVERDRVAADRALREAELIQARAGLVPYLADSIPGTALTPLLVAVDDSMPGAGGAALPPADYFRALVLSSRPEILMARARARAAASDVTVQRALFVRQLGVTFGSKSIAGTPTMIAGLSVPIPVFDRNQGEVKRASAERTAVEYELAWIERAAIAEVAGAHAAALVLASAVAVLHQGSLERAASARRIALDAYREGAAPLLQVIDATRTLAEARLTHFRTLFAWRQGMLDLYAAAGLDPRAALAPVPPISSSSPPRGMAPFEEQP